MQKKTQVKKIDFPPLAREALGRSPLNQNYHKLKSRPDDATYQLFDSAILQLNKMDRLELLLKIKIEDPQSITDLQKSMEERESTYRHYPNFEELVNELELVRYLNFDQLLKLDYSEIDNEDYKKMFLLGMLFNDENKRKEILENQISNSLVAIFKDLNKYKELYPHPSFTVLYNEVLERRKKIEFFPILEKEYAELEDPNEQYKFVTSLLNLNKTDRLEVLAKQQIRNPQSIDQLQNSLSKPTYSHFLNYQGLLNEVNHVKNFANLFDKNYEDLNDENRRYFILGLLSLNADERKKKIEKQIQNNPNSMNLLLTSLKDTREGRNNLYIRFSSYNELSEQLSSYIKIQNETASLPSPDKELQEYIQTPHKKDYAINPYITPDGNTHDTDEFTEIFKENTRMENRAIPNHLYSKLIAYYRQPNVRHDQWNDSLKMLLKCPLTKDFFKDPVVAQDGITYERRALEKHLEEKGNLLPDGITKQTLPLSNKDAQTGKTTPLYTNQMVKALMVKYEPQIIKDKEIEKLNTYISNREAERDKAGKAEYRHIWGSFFGAISAEKKIAAAKALIEVVKKGDDKENSLTKEHLDALKQGNLKEIAEDIVNKYKP